MRKSLDKFKIKVFEKTNLWVMAIVTIVLTLVLLVGFDFFIKDKILPNVSVLDQNVGLLTQVQAIEKISVEHPKTIKLMFGENTHTIELDQVGFSYDYEDTIDKAFAIGRSGGWADNFIYRLVSIYKPTFLEYSINIDEVLLDEYLSVILGNIVEEPVLPSITKTSESLLVNPGEPGIRVDSDRLKSTITNQLQKRFFHNIDMVATQTPSLSDQEISEIQNRADKILDKTIVAVFEDKSITISDLELAQTLLPNNNLESLIRNIESRVNRPSQNAVFTVVSSENGEKNIVKEFNPAKDGLTVNREGLRNKISIALDQLAQSDVEEIKIEIPVTTTSPEVTNESVNSLGINELIGKGSSKFVGSIASRVHNIGVASSKFNGVLIGPNEVFSFNDIVGDISVLTGYQQAYIIKDGATVLGDGGGVCQVSTTLFRAALDAGLPIVERRAHSYRVSYYEQDSELGLDATVYSPTTDLKIKNDTPAHILIQTLYDSSLKTLDFEIYGTSDGRVSTITKPVVTGIVPPPEDLYTDDPNLKVGEVRQIDWKAWGAKASFDYKVQRNGEVIYEKTFHSNYRPWQAKFLRGTAPIN